MLRARCAVAVAVVAFAAMFTTPATAVVGGQPAAARTYPWLAAVGSPLFVLRPSGQFCGGALIAPDRIVTAAHCLYSVLRAVPQVLNVTFDRSDLKSSDGVTVGVSKIWVHPGFHETKFGDDTVEHNDVAVLILAQPQARPTIPIAASPKASATVLGWGTTSESDYFNTRLIQASVPLLPDADCAAAYGVSFDKRDMICAGSPRADTCLFDSGGPLVVDGRLAGLASWASGCARPGFPGVYTRLPTLTAALP